MFDTDGNKLIDFDEFKMLETIFRQSAENTVKQVRTSKSRKMREKSDQALNFANYFTLRDGQLEIHGFKTFTVKCSLKADH